MEKKVDATESALQLIKEIQDDHGPVMFHQSGGCCDGSGEIGGAPFYISGAQYEAWKHTRLTIDAIEGRGGMFSLDYGRG
jgi:uncharacterized protein (DUF779 family)